MSVKFYTDNQILAALKGGKSTAEAAKLLQCDRSTITLRKAQYRAKHGLSQKELNDLIESGEFGDLPDQDREVFFQREQFVKRGQIIEANNSRYVVADVLDATGAVSAFIYRFGKVLSRSQRFFHGGEYRKLNDRIPLNKLFKGQSSFADG